MRSTARSHAFSFKLSPVPNQALSIRSADYVDRPAKLATLDAPYISDLAASGVSFIAASIGQSAFKPGRFGIVELLHSRNSPASAAIELAK